MRRFVLLIGASLLLGIGPDSYAQSTGWPVLAGSVQTGAVPPVPEEVDRGMKADAVGRQGGHMLNPPESKTRITAEVGEIQILPREATTKAVQALRKLGAKIGTDSDGNVVSVNLERRWTNDNDLKHLRHIPELEKLYLARTKTTDAGLRHLRGLSKLRRLSLWGTQVTNAGLKHLAGLTNLEAIDVHSLEITDAGLAHLKSLTRLNYLNLRSTDITNAGLEHLRGKPLRILELGTMFTLTPQGLRCLEGMPIVRLDASVQRSATVYLNGFPRLNYLPTLAIKNFHGEDLRKLRPLTWVRELSIGEKMLADWATYMQQFPNLQYLEIDGRHDDGVTDVHIAQLSQLKKLTALKLMAVRVTNAELAQLARLKKLTVLRLAWIPIVPFGPNVSQFFPRRKGVGVRYRLNSIPRCYPN